MRRKFLVFPRTTLGLTTRWLSFENMVERVEEVDVGGSMEWGNYAYEWMEVGFADEMPLNRASRWNQYANRRNQLLREHSGGREPGEEGNGCN